jgi:hypothetical protein
MPDLIRHPESYTRLDSGLRRNDQKGKDNMFTEFTTAMIEKKQ